jgi:DUF1680 family protein
MTTISRRRFLGCGCAWVCVSCAPSLPVSRITGAVPGSAAELALQQFEYGQVQLGASVLLKQFQQQSRLYLWIDDDKLLKPFRQRAGQPAPGEDMGGWYDASEDFIIDTKDWSKTNWHGFIPGHSFGQYVSGLARSYAITGNIKIKQKVTQLVKKYAATISPRFFEGYTLPAYTYDKLVIGLIDAYRYVGVTEARDALDRLTDAALPSLPEKALTREERRARLYTSEAQIWDEPYTLPENLFLAWRLGMGERYKDLALRYLQDAALFDPLAKGISPFKGKHAYSHINALSSAIQAWQVTGEAKYLAAAKNGFAMLEAQSYATGGWGPNEDLIAADDTETLFKMLTQTHRSFETPCGVYAHFKLTRSLLQITKDTHYGDSMERVLYNTILGARPTLADGSTFYYSDYHQTDAHKVYRGEAWPCCSGTFIQLTADYGISAYLHDSERVYVNLYIPSALDATLGGQKVSIRQQTEYPLADSSVLEINPRRPGEFGIALRIPKWSGANTRIKINGQAWTGDIQPGTFVDVHRTWQPGDTIEIAFDMSLRLEPLNDAHPEMVALLTGPLVLFPIAAPNIPLNREQLLSARRHSASEWLISTSKGEVQLKPFMSIENEHYRLYSNMRLADNN